MLRIAKAPFEQRSLHPSTRMDGSLIHDEDEQQVWVRFKGGDENAFTYLYNQYIVKLYHYGERICRDRTLIEDSVHDFFVELWKNRMSISQTDSVRSYLYRGFKNRLIKNIRKKKNKFSSILATWDEPFEIVFSFESHLIAEQTTEKQKKVLLKCINDLSPRQKEAITLRFFDELSYQEISAIMMLPVKSVYMLIYRAIDWLKQNIGKNVYLCVLAIISCLR